MKVRFSGGLQSCTTKSKVVVQSTLLTLRPNRCTQGLPLRGSRDPLRSAEGGAPPYEGARHCPGFFTWLFDDEGALFGRATDLIWGFVFWVLGFGFWI